jgi:hypothetical protein
VSDDVLRLIGLDEHTDEERAEELRTILVALKTRKLDAYSAGVLNTRILGLLNVGTGGSVKMETIAKATNQNVRTMYRRIQVAKLLAPDTMQDIREALGRGELNAAQAVKLANLRRGGHTVKADRNAVRLLESQAQGRRRLTRVEQARLEGFADGARWAHRALLQDAAKPDWIAALAHDWRESKR